MIDQARQRASSDAVPRPFAGLLRTSVSEPGERASLLDQESPFSGEARRENFPEMVQSGKPDRSSANSEWGAVLGPGRANEPIGVSDFAERHGRRAPLRRHPDPLLEGQPGAARQERVGDEE